MEEAIHKEKRYRSASQQQQAASNRGSKLFNAPSGPQATSTCGIEVSYDRWLVYDLFVDFCLIVPYGGSLGVISYSPPQMIKKC